MIEAVPLQGVWTAIATPFTKDGQVDWPAFERLLDHQRQGGVQGVVVSGTTGETPTLTVQEKISLVRKARASLPKNIGVMAGSGFNNTEQSVELSRLAVDAGADSLLIVTPPYNKPSLRGLVQHFEAIAKSVSVPLCLYHVPGRTAQSLTPAAIAEICRLDSVRAVKEASGDIALFSRAKMASQANFLSGDDPTYLGSLAVGGVGVISVVSNIFPAAMVRLTDLYRKGQVAEATRLHEILLPAIDILFCESNPCPLKAALAIMGLCENTLRLPLVPVSDENYAKIKTTLATCQAQWERV